MKTSFEKNSPTEGTFTLYIDPEDHHPTWEKNIALYSKEVKMKGFRQGHAPRATVKEQYGDQLLYESIFQVAEKVMYEYIQAHNLPILGAPILKQHTITPASKQKPCTVAYLIGLVPPLNLPKKDQLTVHAYQITTIEEENLNEIITAIRRSYATFHPVNTVAKDHILHLQCQIDDKHFNNAYYIDLNQKTTSLHHLFLNKKVGDIIPITHEALQTLTVINPLPKTPKEALLHAPQANLSFHLKTIYNRQLPTLDKDFYTKVLGESIETEDTFRKKLTETIVARDQQKAQQLLHTTLRETYIQATQLPLPDDILKVWLLSKGDKSLTTEKLATDYPSIAKAIRWDLILEKLAKDHSIALSEEEIQASLIRTLQAYDQAQGHLSPQTDTAEDRAKSLLQNNKDNLRAKIERKLKEDKVLEIIKAQAHITEIPLTSRAFYIMLEKSNQRNT